MYNNADIRSVLSRYISRTTSLHFALLFASDIINNYREKILISECELYYNGYNFRYPGEGHNIIRIDKCNNIRVINRGNIKFVFFTKGDISITYYPDTTPIRVDIQCDISQLPGNKIKSSDYIRINTIKMLRSIFEYRDNGTIYYSTDEYDMTVDTSGLMRIKYNNGCELLSYRGILRSIKSGDKYIRYSKKTRGKYKLLRGQ